jgi:hypothetical protein
MKENIFNCEAFDLQQIGTIDEVKKFAKYLAFEVRLNFHPDDDFICYLDSNSNEQLFSNEDIVIGNKLMNDCFDVCERENIDVYEVMGKYLYDSITIKNGDYA